MYTILTLLMYKHSLSPALERWSVNAPEPVPASMTFDPGPISSIPINAHMSLGYMMFALRCMSLTYSSKLGRRKVTGEPMCVVNGQDGGKPAMSS